MVDNESAILHVLASRLCAQVILFLQGNPAAKYSDLLQACSLDPYCESGKLSYHLNRLISSGLIIKGDSTYTLTEKGRQTSRLFEIIKREIREILEGPKRRIKREDLILRVAVYTDLGELIGLWRSSFQDDMTDYHIATCFTDTEGLRTKTLRHQGHGKGRLTFVSEHEGEVIGCCLVDLMSLAHMKAEYMALVREGELPTELRFLISEGDKQFNDKYWEAESELIETNKRIDGYIETKFGVTGTWGFPYEPIELIFTRKRLDAKEYVTADLEEIFGEILSCRKLMAQAIDIRKRTREAIDGDNPAYCFEIAQLLSHSEYEREEVASMVLRHVEGEASKRRMGYVVTSEGPNEIKARRFWKDNGFIAIHQHGFEYKNAGRAERYLMIKKL